MSIYFIGYTNIKLLSLKTYDIYVDSSIKQRNREAQGMDFRKHVLLRNVGRYVNYEYRRDADMSRRNGNQLGVPSYDWDLSYWQATLANLHWDLAGLSRRPTAFWFPPGLNPWDSILLPTMRPYLYATSSPLRAFRSCYFRQVTIHM